MHQLARSGGHPEDMQEHLIPIYQVENRAIAAAANYVISFIKMSLIYKVKAKGRRPQIITPKKWAENQ